MQKVILALFTCLFLVFSFHYALSADVSKGKELYKKCSSCHKSDASGRGLNKLNSEEFEKELIKIRDDTSSKNKAMKNIFKTYTQEDINNINAYIQSL